MSIIVDVKDSRFGKVKYSVEIGDDLSEKIHYTVSDYPIYIYGTYLSNFPDFEFPGHWHDDIEMTVILDGEMIYNVNGEKFHIKRGEGIWVNSKMLHSTYSVSKGECYYICVRLNPSLLSFSFSFENDFVKPVINCSDLPCFFLNPDILWQGKIIELIKQIYEARDLKILPLKTQKAFYEMWCLLWENISFENNTSVKESMDLTITKNMIAFIQKNFTKRLTLSQIASAGAVGQSKCCKLFARYFEKSPILYLNNYRLNKSMELLKNTDLSITEIALRVGFGSASYYAEAFKKCLGKTPSEFRHTEIDLFKNV